MVRNTDRMNAEIDISGVTLKTERLIIRPWRMEDLADFYEYASVDGVGQAAGWSPHKSIDESRVILTMFIEGKNEFTLECNGKAIGSLGIERYNEERFPEFETMKCREIGYVLDKDYWGQGLMTEAVRELIRYLFEDVKLDVILCSNFIDNVRSARVKQKNGFRHYSFGKYHTLMDTWVDDDTGILTRKEWQNRNLG